MKRRIFSVFAVSSLLLVVATVLIWVRSYWYCDGAYGSLVGMNWDTISLKGECGLGLTIHPGFRQETRRSTASTAQFRGNLGDSYRRHLWGFAVTSEPARPDDPDGWYGWYVRAVFPHWFLGMLLLLLPALWLGKAGRQHLRNKRVKFGFCLACGYDLRAHEPGQRCPECGTTIPENAEVCSQPRLP